ncbi:MAG TPA: hypothetical protein VF483_01225 [Gemmatimonadaceae bacterium]
MSVVREFVADEIPDVVALRRSAFAHSAHRTDSDLGAYFERIFFRNPWNTGAQSLVHVEDDGRVTGFLGVIGRSATFRDAPIDVAVCTQFMVDARERGVAAVRLLKTLFSGKQDLALADVSNDQSRRMWVALGGSALPAQARLWTQPLRPLRYRAARSHSAVIRGAARVVRPFLDAWDEAGITWTAPVGLSAVPLTPELLSENAALVGPVALRTTDDAESTRWLLEQLRVKEDLGTLRGRLLRGGTRVVGWFLYFESIGGVGEVVQLVAAPGRHRDVLAALFHDAWKLGLVAVTGRADRDIVGALDPRRACLRDGDTAMLVHSPRQDINEAIRRDDAYFSRLDGEWWMSF